MLGFFSVFTLNFFLKSSNLTLLKFKGIEQIKEIKVILESFSLNRMCFERLEPLTSGLDQIDCLQIQLLAVKGFIALSAS